MNEVGPLFYWLLAMLGLVLALGLPFVVLYLLANWLAGLFGRGRRRP